MDVIALERVVDDAELAALRRLAQRALELAHEGARPQRRNLAAGLDRDVGRTAPRVRITSDVMDDAVQLPGPARARPGPAAAGPAPVVIEAELPSATHRIRLRLSIGDVKPYFRLLWARAR
jgi:hypothetical protein